MCGPTSQISSLRERPGDAVDALLENHTKLLWNGGDSVQGWQQQSSTNPAQDAPASAQQSVAMSSQQLAMEHFKQHSRRLPSIATTAAGAGVQGVTPPLSPRSACSTPGRATADALAGPAMYRRHGAPRRQLTGLDAPRRLSHEVVLSRGFPASLKPWSSFTSEGTCSIYSGSSSCSLVRAIASLGLEGAAKQDSRRDCGGSRMPRSARGSISKAKQILAEAISSVPGAHGLGHCASATDTGVLSPLLTIIRNNGVSKASTLFADAGLHGSRNGAHRRSSFCESSSVMRSARLAAIGSDSTSSRVLRRASFSEAAGGLNSLAFGGSDSVNSSLAGLATSRPPSCNSSGNSPDGTAPQDLPATPESATPLVQTAAQQQQKVVDCLETVRYLAMDHSNRMALIDLGAIELLLDKIQRQPSDVASKDSSSRGTSPAVVEGALSALSALAKHDPTKLRVWDNPSSAALLQLLSCKHTSSLVKAAHLCVAHLAWSSECDKPTYQQSCNSSLFDSVSSHVGRCEDTASTSSSCCGTNVLLTPALIPALAAGLHPAADTPVLLSLLKMLTKAASSSCLEASPAVSPSSASSSSSSVNGSSCRQLCTVQSMRQAAPAWRVGWQQVIFALPTLLLLQEQQHSSAWPQHQVVAAALELLVALVDQHPEFSMLVCAAGCIAPLLAILLGNGGSSSSSCSCSSNGHCLEHQAACVLSGLVDCPAAMEELGQERALQVLLCVLNDSSKSVDTRLAMIHMLRRMAAASQSCVRLMKALGAVQVIRVLLQQVHDSDVKRASALLLQLLGTQVVVRPRRPRHNNTGDDGSRRSSFESDCSACSEQRHTVKGLDAAAVAGSAVPHEHFTSHGHSSHHYGSQQEPANGHHHQCYSKEDDLPRPQHGQQHPAHNTVVHAFC